VNIPTQAKGGLEWVTRERKKRTATAVLDTALRKAMCRKLPKVLKSLFPPKINFSVI
jgi:hypothetical protein